MEASNKETMVITEDLIFLILNENVKNLVLAQGIAGSPVQNKFASTRFLALYILHTIYAILYLQLDSRAGTTCVLWRLVHNYMRFPTRDTSSL